ncbi:LysE family translocator [Chlorobium sp.]|jgi:threonine/homoserine/homoserine lactone efflux protein|uniref:LysE family translocator n=1 Tax=Chlorobium sp. TaxID=1095 RepID=UPI003C4D28B7
MPELNQLFVFFAASALLALSPGPDNLFVMAQSVQNGRIAGLLVTLGLSTGLVVHTLAVAFGLAALVAASSLAFTLLKFAGAAYLLYLAWKAFRSGASVCSAVGEGPADRWRLYRRGIVMNISNPKVSIFFLAFLPQFADPSRGPVVPQLLVLGLLFMVATMLVFGTLSMLAGGAGARLRQSEPARKIIDRIAGAIFGALALKLLLAER